MIDIYVLMFGLIAIATIVWMFIMLVFSIIRSMKDKNNLYITLQFASIILTLFLNIYAFTFNIETQTEEYLFLMRASGASFMIGITFSLVYLARIKTHFNQKQHFNYWILTLIYLGLNSVYVLFGGGEIGENFEPVYPRATTIYVFSIYLILIAIFIFESVNIHQLAPDAESRKKIDFVIIGVFSLSFILIVVQLANAQLIPVVYVILVFFLCSTSSSVLLYKGFSF